ncbi:MAG: cupin domain-containing protein [Pseudomonadales bacterium]|jgi:uncharacterized cupin superfamily protein|nr:cupin domain-containing protein [Pseudomonadales bacterium]
MPTERGDAVPCLLDAATIAAMPEERNVHQFNANGVRHARNLGDALGLRRLGVHLVRLEPGRDSTTFHFHEADEEFVYVLSGRGIAEIGEERAEVGPGDFMAFTAPSPGHLLRNPFEEDLVYLMGGERNAVDVVRYPRDGWTLVKTHGRREGMRSDRLEDV